VQYRQAGNGEWSKKGERRKEKEGRRKKEEKGTGIEDLPLTADR
jgi:hypothetical protein